ncbi:replication factor C subunit 1 [Frankliniella occidentalis]|uniref:Activator 1 large subunit n=1 Tax=Frankliniella occidentalis TaxID=133901 RepID=A0A6J1T5Q1_FRAOC|nr:replication factor C subunit 1 [Frankliniella occidentalis]XP_052122300.1 replication factor C subunit 1 [Frankliniella occidentalis]
MSKDIRSFFSVQSSKKKSNESDKKNSKEPTRSSNKKKRAVIESDSDEDIEIFEPKKKKTSPAAAKKESKIEKKTVNAADVFGSDTVKRTNRPSTSKVSELHNDSEFDKVLQDLDESAWASDDLFDETVSKPAPKETSKTTSISPSPPGKDSSPPMKRPSETSKSPVKKAVQGEAEKNVKHTTMESASTSKSSIKESSPKKLKLEKIESALTVQAKEIGSSKDKNQQKLEKPSVKVEIKSEKANEKANDTRPKLEPSPPSYMWVDKYKPTSVKQIIGQQGDNSNVKKLLRWLSSWHSNHGTGVNKKLVRPSPWAKDDNGAFFKAALLSGPPGIGKTTAAHLVCKELGMDVVEFNASDTRSQKLMSKEVGELLSSKSLLPFFQSGGESKTSAKHVLVMDEVDGMAGNEDRGGVGELISLIKNSKCPVICMCNDRNHTKIRSLAGYCFDLRFHKPRVEQIRGAMMSVCFKEKVQISPQALDEVISGTNCDIRQVLNNLSMWSSTEKKMNTEQVKTDANAAKKNIKLGPWDAVKKIFSSEDHKTMSLMDKSDLFFHDYSLLPLFVQENYLISSPHAAKKRTDSLHHIARAAASISYGDLIEKTIRSKNSWSLLPVQSIFSSVVPGDWMEGHFTGQIQFPSWLGKNSRGLKMSRMLQELQVHMRLSISGGKQAVNLDYIQPILNAIIRPLIAEGSQGVPKTMQAMQDYFITRDDLDSLLEVCKWPNQADPMAGVDSKVKAALTRAYNKAGGLMIPYALDVPVKKKKASAAVEEGYGGEEEEEEGESDDDKSDDDDAADGMIKAKKPEKKAASASSSSSSQASSSRGSRGGARGSGQPRGRGRGRGKK